MAVFAEFQMPTTATRFDSVAPGLARLVLAVLAVATVISVLVALPMVDREKDPARHGDLQTYSLVVERLQAGEPYYQALHTELLAGGYGVRSIFNWRPPLFLLALSMLPSPVVAQGILVVLAAAGLTLGCSLVVRAGPAVQIGLGVLFPLSFLSIITPVSAYMCELYAGALILISVSAYARRLIGLGFVAAVLALLVRELAIVYALICVGLAFREGRRREVMAWAIALAGFVAYYVWHGVMVMQTIGPNDPGYASGWLQFGGLSFDLATARFNGIFMLLPFWVTALMLPLALLGLLAWPSPASPRVALVVFAYLVAFAVVGKAVNVYWGALYAPLLAFGLVWAPPALRDLIAAATRPVPTVERI